MNLHLKRPLAFFDLETTGVNISSDRLVEIAIIKVMPDQTEEVYTKRVHPERSIPLESSLIHGIYDEDVVDAPTFKQIAPEVVAFLGDSDLAGYNSNKFDIPMLMEELLRAGVDFSLEDRYFVDVQNIFHQMEQRTLKAAYSFYCHAKLENAHSAEADVRATYEVLKAQLDRYKDVPYESKSGETSFPVQNDVAQLHTFTNLSRPVDFAGRIVYNNEGKEVFSFGKHKGVEVTTVFVKEPSYFAWMMNGDFPLYTKKCLERLWNAFKGKQKEQREQAQQKEGAKNAPRTSNSSASIKGKTPSTPSERPKKDAPITNDMLKNLQAKFGK
jgi:DNA polymerase-3 subunit epsilon